MPPKNGAEELQERVFALLADEATHGSPAGGVERIDTSISAIFLAGDRALKAKLAVDMGFCDFTTLEKRKADCEREVALNRRLAPMIYRGVVAVTQEPDGRLALEGDGKAVEWLVDMVRFDRENELDRLAEEGRLTLEIMERLADKVAQFHRSIEIRRDMGGLTGFSRTLRSNDDQYRVHAGTIFETSAIDDLTRHSLAFAERYAFLLDRRRDKGWVRHCHGDLHLGNITLIDGDPVPFDCIEFNERIACIDVLYDLAFAVMDLWERGLEAHANRYMSRYFARLHADEVRAHAEGLAVLPGFLSCRAGIRAFVAAHTAARHEERETRSHNAQAARRYFAFARRLLAPPGPRLVAVGGLSGTGKSALARRLAPALGAVPGALVLRSDEIRKRLFDVAPEERLPQSAYSSEVSARVYGEIEALAAIALRAGHAVIADAVYARAPERERLDEIAKSAGVPFDGLWLQAPAEVLAGRIEGRTDDASDATVNIMRRQQAYDTGDIDWHRVDAAGAPSETLRNAHRALNVESGGANDPDLGP